MKKEKHNISFTSRQMKMLRKEKENTGNTITSIVRQAVNEYFEKRLGQKLQNLNNEKGE